MTVLVSPCLLTLNMICFFAIRLTHLNSLALAVQKMGD